MNVNSNIDIKDFIQSLEAQNICFSLEGDKLKIKAEKGRMDSAIMSSLQGNKERIIDYLRSKQKRSYGLSFAQNRLWFLEQYEKDSTIYHMPGILLIRGELNIPVLNRAIEKIIRRQDSLRTNIVTVNNEVIQRVSDKVQWHLKLVDISNDESAGNIEELIKKELNTCFDLESESLFRTVLYKTANDEYVLFVNMHHIISDMWSVSIIIKELAFYYNTFLGNRNDELPDLSIQYIDYTAWQNDYLNTDTLKEQLSYWKTQLQNAKRVSFPEDFPRPTIKTFNGASLPVLIGPEITHRIKALCKDYDTSLYMILLAAFKILMYKYTGEDDICVGSPIANRHKSQLENIIGFFANTLVFRTQLGNNPTFSDYLKEVKKTALDAYSNQDIPFDKVVEAVLPERDPAYTPLFQVMFVLQNSLTESLNLPGLDIERKNISTGTAKFDITLQLFEDNDQLSGMVEYNTDIFKEDTIQEILNNFNILLQSIIDNPLGRISTLSFSDDERGCLVNSCDVLNREVIQTILQSYVGLGLESGDFEAVVMDQYENILPAGITGELYLRSKLITEDSISFVNDQVIMLKTIDKTRYLKCGFSAIITKDHRLEVLSSLDNKAMINGVLVNLSLVEAAIITHFAVKDCAVIVKEHHKYGKTLVAFMTTTSPISSNIVSAYLHNDYPTLHIPAAFVEVNSIPRNSDGNVDTSSLQQISITDDYVLSMWEKKFSELGILRTCISTEKKQSVENMLHVHDLIEPQNNRVYKTVTEHVNDDWHQSNNPKAYLDGGEVLYSKDTPTTMSDALLTISEKYPDKGLYVYQSETDHTFLSYKELMNQAQSYLAGLYEYDFKAGDCVILQISDLVDFFPVLWGCVLGGIIPVTVSIPPVYDSNNTIVNKLQNCWKLLGKPSILCSNNLYEGLISLNDELFDSEIKLLKITDVHKQAVEEIHSSQPDNLVFYQLSSGSTGTPKCVQETHAGIIDYILGSVQCCSYEESDRTLNWLPFDHVGPLLMCHMKDTYLGCDQIIVNPEVILSKPLVWLDLIEEYKVTHSWSPNFGFKLVAEALEQIAEKDRDLSSIEYFLNGGEQVTQQVVKKFLNMTSSFNLKPNCIQPAYGMAEVCTAMIYQNDFTLENGFIKISTDSLAGELEIVDENQDTDFVEFTNLGRVRPGMEIRITNNSHEVLPEKFIGNLQVRGISVTPGYIYNDEANLESFVGDDWFDTGDLAFMYNQDLFVTGRSKEMIIIRGANFYCYELEDAVTNIEGVEPTYVAALGVENSRSGTEELAIFFVPETEQTEVDYDLIKIIKLAISSSFGVSPTYIIPVTKSKFPKTSSGKIQRSVLKEDLLSGKYDDIRKRIDLKHGNNVIPDWFYKNVWSRKTIDSISSLDTDHETIIFTDSDGIGKHLILEMQNSIAVEIGSAFEKVGKRHYRINPEKSSDYRRLFSSLANDALIIKRIIHLYSYNNSLSSKLTKQTIDQDHDKGVYSLLNISRSLFTFQDKAIEVNLYFFTNNAQQVLSSDKLSVAKTTATGVLKTIPAELPMKTYHIDLEYADISCTIPLIIKELRAVHKDQEIAYRNGNRYISGLENVVMSEYKDEHLSLLKQGGVYIVTGGMGGIGSDVAKYLLEVKGARLLLVGRTKFEDLTPVKKNVFQLLSSMGDVHYFDADITNSRQVKKIIEEVVIHWGDEPDGVFHLAGSIHEKSIAEETKFDFEEILKTKIYGTINLYNGIKDLNNAIFINFSSVNMFFGGSNVSAYSAANAFQVNFIRSIQRNSTIKSCCIMWSLWKNTGMSKKFEHMISASEAMGFYPINSSDGIVSLETALYNGFSEVMIGLKGPNSNISQYVNALPYSLTDLYAYLETDDKNIINDIAKQNVKDSYNVNSFCHIIPVDTIPLLENGDFDITALKSQVSGAISSNSEISKQVSDTEKKLIDIWKELLGTSNITPTDNFFDLGGNSLLTTQLISRLNDQYSISLKIKNVFQFSTIEGLARYIDEESVSDSGTNMTIKKVDFDDNPPLSFAQERLWFLDQFEPSHSVYHMPGLLKLQGIFNIDACRKSLNMIVEHHETLRTNFVSRNGSVTQVIHNSGNWGLDTVYVDSISVDKAEPVVFKSIEEDLRTPFDLEKDPLLRTTLFILEDNTYYLYVNMHHIISDGWSIGVMINEFVRNYSIYNTQEDPQLTAPDIQYKDYAYWQKEYLKGEVFEKQLTYWKDTLEGVPVLDMPLDYQRPRSQTYNGKKINISIPTDICEGLDLICSESESTLFMVLMTAFKVLLYRYSGQKDICVGTPIANRTLVEVESLIGFFVNTLAIRDELDGDMNFTQLLKKVKATTLKAYENQDIPFEKIVEELRLSRNLSYSPLFQVMFILQNAPSGSLTLPELSIDLKELSTNTAKFDLTMSLTETSDGIEGTIEYNTDIYSEESVEGIARSYNTLLESIVKSQNGSLDDLSMISDHDKKLVLSEWTKTNIPFDDDCGIHAIVEKQAARIPAKIAVVFNEEMLTYDELNKKASQLAHYLKSKGVGEETYVGVCVERSLDLIVTLLAVVKAGGVYVALDATYPEERLTYMLNDTNVPIIITQESFVELLPSHQAEKIVLDRVQDEVDTYPANNPQHDITGESLAYVSYTSGSTGVPKGVQIVHKGINRLVAQKDLSFLNEDSVVMQYAPVAFDASTFEIWGALANGATLVVMPPENLSIEDLGSHIMRHEINTLWLTAPLFHNIVEYSIKSLKNIKYLLAGGDVLSPVHVKKALDTVDGLCVINGYGPTENTTFTTLYPLSESSQIRNTVPIGKSLNNTKNYILDERLNPVPIGVPGELYTSGAGLARGYLNQPELTDDKFIDNPFEEDTKLYKTGDLVRYQHDGNIEFLGRIDTQVKIRGFRIELDEIDNVIADIDGVSECVVVVKQYAHDEKRLICYYVPRDASISGSFIQEKISTILPNYMIPAAFVKLKSLPLSANGKIERKALPDPANVMEKIAKYVAPQNPTQEVLVEMIKTLLALEQVSIKDNFFKIGGHSLLAARLVSDVNDTMGINLPLKALFEINTIEELSAIIDVLQDTNDDVYDESDDMEMDGLQI